MAFQDECLILSALPNVLDLEVCTPFESKVVSLCLFHFSKVLLLLFTVCPILHILLFSPIKFETHLCGLKKDLGKVSGIIISQGFQLLL